MMFKKSNWSSKSKKITTIVGSILVAFMAVAIINAPPTATLDNLKLDSNKSVDSEHFNIIGSIFPTDSTITINSKVVRADSQGKFIYSVPLKEGDNDITVVTKKGDKQSTSIYKLHRYTKAEIDKQKADKALQLKKEIDAKTAAELKSKQESDKKAADSKSAEAEKKAVESAKTAAAALAAAEKKAEADAAAAKKAAEEAAKAKTITEDEYVFLVDQTKETVKKVLKAPSTAEFQGSWLDPYDGWGIYTIGTSVLRLASVVDSENSFGAMIRSSFSITFCKANSQYQITLFVFDGETLLQKACSN